MLLLDTHVVLWLDSGMALAEGAIAQIDAAAAASRLFVSPVSAWEIGLLVSKGRVSFDLPAAAWLDRFLALPGLRMAPLTAQIALASSFLPAPFHSDPADRLLVATARQIGCRIVSRDSQIQRYADEGHVGCLQC